METLNFTPIEEAPVVSTEQITPDSTPPKKGPGRPRKIPAPAQSAPASSGKSAFDIVDNLAKETKAAEQPGAPAQVPESPGMKAVAGTFINGKMVIVILDIVFPMVLKMFMKELKKAPLGELRLSKEQAEIIGPISDEVAAYVLRFLDPLTLFVICTGSMYYQNATDALAKVKKEAKK